MNKCVIAIVEGPFRKENETGNETLIKKTKKEEKRKIQRYTNIHARSSVKSNNGVSIAKL